MSGLEDIISERSLDLAEIALESAAQSCQSGASLRNHRTLDPLAKEYLVAANQIAKYRDKRSQSAH